MIQTEAHVVSQAPFKVIHQRPIEVTLNVCPVFDGFGKRIEISPNEPEEEYSV